MNKIRLEYEFAPKKTHLVSCLRTHGSSAFANAGDRLNAYEEGDYGKPHLDDKGRGTSLMIQS